MFIKCRLSLPEPDLRNEANEKNGRNEKMKRMKDNPQD
jgi:hypothetical protein